VADELLPAGPRKFEEVVKSVRAAYGILRATVRAGVDNQSPKDIGRIVLWSLIADKVNTLGGEEITRREGHADPTYPLLHALKPNGNKLRAHGWKPEPPKKISISVKDHLVYANQLMTLRDMKFVILISFGEQPRQRRDGWPSIVQNRGKECGKHVIRFIKML